MRFRVPRRHGALRRIADGPRIQDDIVSDRHSYMYAELIKFGYQTVPIAANANRRAWAGLDNRADNLSAVGGPIQRPRAIDLPKTTDCVGHDDLCSYRDAEIISDSHVDVKHVHR